MHAAYGPDETPAQAARAQFEPQRWRRQMRLTWLLAGLWFTVTFVLTWFARDLSFVVFDWPFALWMASQGALLVYLFIVWRYARSMDRLDHEAATAAGTTPSTTP